MALKVAVIYNQPEDDRYSQMGEAEAVAYVLEEVRAVAEALGGMGYIVQEVPLVPPLDAARRIKRRGGDRSQ